MPVTSKSFTARHRLKSRPLNSLRQFRSCFVLQLHHGSSPQVRAEPRRLTRRSMLVGALAVLTVPAAPWAWAQDPPAAKEDTTKLSPIKSVIVDHHPSQEMLKLLEVEAWPVWTCEESQVSQSYSVDEDCYLVEGDVVIIPTKGPQVQIKAGDFVTFPKGYACVWDVKKPVVKRYKQLVALSDDPSSVVDTAGPGATNNQPSVVT